MNKSITPRHDHLAGLRRVVLGASTLLWLLSATWAQQTVPMGQSPQITELTPTQTENDGARLAQEWQALCDQMRAQKLPPDQWIQQVENWKKANAASLEAASTKMSARSKLQQRPDAPVALPTRSTDNLTGDELTLADLEEEINQAVQELNTSKLGPAQRIRAVDDFLRLNKNAFQSVQVLRKKIRDAKVGKAKTDAPVAPVNLPQTQSVSPAIQVLMTQRDAILNEINTKLDAWDQLIPVERIAAMDREKSFIAERTATLRQINQQIQSSSK